MHGATHININIVIIIIIMSYPHIVYFDDAFSVTLDFMNSNWEAYDKDL
jgi:hypothetical protein